MLPQPLAPLPAPSATPNSKNVPGREGYDTAVDGHLSVSEECEFVVPNDARPRVDRPDEDTPTSNSLAFIPVSRPITSPRSQKTRIQIWLFEQPNLRIEGRIIVSSFSLSPAPARY